MKTYKADPKDHDAVAKALLEKYRDQSAAAPTKERKCLCCNNKFLSQGPHNRLCTTCRGKSVSPYAL